jgi:hypothetical protein
MKTLKVIVGKFDTHGLEVKEDIGGTVVVSSSFIVRQHMARTLRR